jgi:hypothetical protein
VEEVDNNSLGYEILLVESGDGALVSYILQGSNGSEIHGQMLGSEQTVRAKLTAQVSEANKRRKRMQEWPGWNWAQSQTQNAA